MSVCIAFMCMNAKLTQYKMLFEECRICIGNMIIQKFPLDVCPVIFLTVKHHFHQIFNLQSEDPARKRKTRVQKFPFPGKVIHQMSY